MLVSFPKSCCRLHLCLFSNKLCLITMLIELNCFFTLLCVVMAGMWKYFSTRLPTCESRQSKRYFWRGISTKREFHYFSSLARSLCVILHRKQKTTSRTNLSSFHKSKLWIYRFFQSLLALFQVDARGFRLLRCSLSEVNAARWNLFRNWGWQAFNLEGNWLGWME